MVQSLEEICILVKIRIVSIGGKEVPRVNKYNVYDNGNLVLENVTSRVIINTLGCTISLPRYAEEKTKWKGRYTFESCGVEEKVAAVDPIFENEWNAAVALFKNVIWVKAGGRKLCVNKT